MAEWARGKGMHQLIGTLHEVLPRSVLISPIECPDTKEGVKRAYFQAVRLVHPDRLANSLSEADKQLCSQTFVKLNNAFDAFRSNA